MTSEQKSAIECLRLQGHGHRFISRELGINDNTLKSYIRRTPLPTNDTPEEAPATVKPVASGLSSRYARATRVSSSHDKSSVYKPCRLCGTPVLQTPGRKEKAFCSASCCSRWWNKNRHLPNKNEQFFEISASQ